MLKVLPYNLYDVNNEVQELIDGLTGDAGDLYMKDFCVQASAGNGCDNILVKDITDYTGMDRIDETKPSPNYIYVSLYEVGEGVLDVLVASEVDMGVGGSYHFKDLKEGCYEVRIRAYFHLLNGEDDVFIDRVLPVNLDCCKEDREKLKCTLSLKIAQIGCKIRDYSYMGRDSSALFNALNKLEAILWAVNSICECKPKCEDVRIFKNATNKVISTCNC